MSPALHVPVPSPSAPARVLTYTEQNEIFSVYKTQWVSLTRTECKICHSEKQVVHLPEPLATANRWCLSGLDLGAKKASEFNWIIVLVEVTDSCLRE